MLVWLIAAAARAPHVQVWTHAEWQNHVTLAAMSAACLILALGLGRPNPFSFGGGQDHRFDPARPGIVGLTRHPVLWSLGHLAPNGDLAHLLLFAGFAAFACLGMAMIDRRWQRDMGQAAWRCRFWSGRIRW